MKTQTKPGWDTNKSPFHNHTTPVARQNAYIKTKLEEVYDMINDCPCTDASTIKLLNIVEKLTFVVSTIAKEGGLV